MLDHDDIDRAGARSTVKCSNGTRAVKVMVKLAARSS